jgi:hypothetical protein
VTEDANEKVFRVIVRLGPVMPSLMENIFEGKWMEVCTTTEDKSYNGECSDDIPYLSARALITSQLIPPILIHLTLTHDSFEPAFLSAIMSINDLLVIRLKLLLTDE